MTAGGTLLKLHFDVKYYLTKNIYYDILKSQEVNMNVSYYCI